MKTPCLAIVGAHTELARTIVEMVVERELGVEVRKFTDAAHITDGLELLGPELLEVADIIVLAAQSEISDALCGRESRVPVLDLVGASTGALTFPQRTENLGPLLRAGGVFRLPVGLAGTLVSLIDALGPLGLAEMSIVTAESAAIYDKPGMDELMDQVRAVYTMQDPTAAILGGQLAFNVLPTGSAQDSPGVGDLELEAAIKAVAPELQVWVTRTMVPTVAVDSAAVHCRFENAAESAAVAEAIRQALGIRLVEEGLPSAADAIDRQDAVVGRLRQDGRHLGLWCAVDRFCGGSASSVLTALERWLEVS